MSQKKLDEFKTQEGINVPMLALQMEKWGHNEETLSFLGTWERSLADSQKGNKEVGPTTVSGLNPADYWDDV